MRTLAPLLLLLLVVRSAQAKIVTQPVEYKQGDTTLEGYLAYDDSISGKRPGVLIAHQWTGLTDYEKMRARMLAELGYVAFAVDIYGKGIHPKPPRESGELVAKYKGDRALLRARMKAGLDELLKNPNVDPKRVGAIGYCFGGSAVLELARSSADIAGVVSFHGGLDNPNPDDAKNIRCAVLALSGGNDPNVPPAQVDAFLKEMQACPTQWDFVAYGHAVHSFTQKDAGDDPSKGAAYNAHADRESWEAMKNFFANAFGQTPSPAKDK